MGKTFALNNRSGVSEASQGEASASQRSILYRFIRGEVACDAHAPEPSSARWVDERWAQVPATSRHRHGVDYQCQYCSHPATPLACGRQDTQAP